MWHLTRLALRNRLVTLLIVVMLTGASIWAVLTLKMELIPNIEFPYATVITVYPGATPEEIETDITSRSACSPTTSYSFRNFSKSA